MRLNRKPLSPGRIAWIRFKRNRVAMACLSFIILSVVVALLGYLITPDTTSNADQQQLELATVPPGTTIILMHDLAGLESKTHWLRWWIYGTDKSAHRIPIRSTQKSNDSVLVVAIRNYRYGQIDTLVIAENQYQLRRQTFLLGTDGFGRDVLSRLIIGARVSIMVGTVAVMISLAVGIFLGSIAGYYRGRLDQIILWLINVVWSIPTLLLVIAISLMLGKGLAAVFVAVGLTMWVDVARIVRGQFLSFREKEFVEAGRALGFQDARIITRHILPNITGPILVVAASNFAAALLIESGLSFLGYGVQPPIPTWGNMIEANRNFLITDRYYLALIPGLAIMLLVLSFTMVGDGLRKALVSNNS